VARDSNAVDFWRGFALITIFINHIPGNLYERLTYSRYSISDAADLFVFLAGWSIALAVRGREGPDSPRRVVLRLASRTLEVYRAQLVITAIALAMIAAAAIVLDNPLLLEWHNAGPVFSDPVQTTLGWVALTHQLGYFNILPLYVGLLALAPIFVLLARASRALALGISLTIYASSLAFEINLPSWPVEGSWFFNPLAWQLLLVLGFLCCEWSRDDPRFPRLCKRLQPFGIAFGAFGFVMIAKGWMPDPLAVPEPRAFFVNDKSYMSPLRLIHFLALAAAVQGVFDIVKHRLPKVAEELSSLGRNSLAVFCVGSIASLAAQFVRFVTGGGWTTDTIVTVVGVICLVFTAWFVEWRVRSPRPSSLSS
jgi:hypothetical protein